MNLLTWKLLLMSLLATWSASVEACREPVKTQLAGKEYPDEVSAVRAMSDRFLQMSRMDDVEFFGALLKSQEGAYRASYSKGCPGRDQIEFTIPVSSGLTVSALWHTHGDRGYARELFSAEDAATVVKHAVPFYLIDPAGLIRVLDPDDAALSGNRYLKSSRLRQRHRAYSGELVSEATSPTQR